MKIKRFKFWYRLVDYVILHTDKELVLEIIPHNPIGFKYSLKKYDLEETPDIILETNSKEEVKIWMDLRGYKCKELLIDGCSSIYCILLSNKHC